MGIKINRLKVCFSIFCTAFCLLFLHAISTDARDINPIVRVAISNNNFKTFVYNEISIIATSDYGIYDKSTAMPVIKLSATDITKLKYKDGKFEIFVNDKSTLKNVAGTLVLDCRDGLLGVNELKRRGKQALYHGNFEIIPKNENLFFLINILDLQEYLKGVVPNEMPVRFGLEALKAQAVAARNYVLLPRTRAYKEFDVDDSVASQVYYGANTEDELANKAVAETQGLIAMHNSKLILAQYCSTAGGYTENWHNAFPDTTTKLFYPTNPKPYLKGRPDMFTQCPLNTEEAARKYYMTTPDSYDMKSPYYRWKKEFTIEEINNTLPKMLITQSKTGFVSPKFEDGHVFGTLKDIKVLRRGVSGKIMEMEIVTDKGSWRASKELVIRRLFPKNGISLPSANVVFDIMRDENNNITNVTAFGGGFGHGVGMSQFGAGFMSTELHKTFDKILKRYYTGISLSTIPITISDKPGQKIAVIQFYAPYKKGTLVVENSYHVKDFSVNINNVEVPLNHETSHKNEIRIDISNYVKKGKNEAVFVYPETEKNKSITLYVELVEKDDSEYNF